MEKECIEQKGQPESVALSATLRAIHECGFNTMMIAHPAPEYFYDCCDAIGLMVCDRCGLGADGDKAQEVANGDDWADAILYRAFNMIKRDHCYKSCCRLSVESSPNAHNLKYNNGYGEKNRSHCCVIGNKITLP